MMCSICLYVAFEDVAAVTVMNGHAVCADHVGYVAGPIRSQQEILAFVVEQAGFTSLAAMQAAGRR